LKFTDVMTRDYEFRRLYAKGKSVATARMVLYCRKNRLISSRLGITVSTKIGKAVHRNKIRRRFREIYRLNEQKLSPGWDVVIVARGKSKYSEYSQLEADFLYLAEKLGILAR